MRDSPPARGSWRFAKPIPRPVAAAAKLFWNYFQATPE
jgi:hypothetical protein